jgi:hypothetical protein
LIEGESLRGLVNALFEGGRLNLEDYYGFLVDVVVYMPVWKLGTGVAPVGFDIDGTQFGLLFMSPEAAESVLARTPSANLEHLGARLALQRIPDGWGLIVDWSTSWELRITPDAVTELNERFGVWQAATEATDEWLSRLNNKFPDLPPTARAERAMEEWRRENGFRVVRGSRRARWIEHFFVAHADGAARCKEAWRSDYERDPYLRGLGPAELKAREQAILTNLAYADRDPARDELTPHEWAELLEHVQFECERRQIPPIAGGQDALRPSAPSSYAVPQNLYRFSKRRYLEPLLSSGLLTIFPAARYSDPSLLAAQRDDELARKFAREGSWWRSMAQTNYYVLFASWSFDPRLFYDFDADACLVIHDVRDFTERLMGSVEKVLPDQDWVGGDRLVRYYDPLRPRELELVRARFEKDFRFAYQREFRYVWEPTTERREGLPPLECMLGPLDDICSLIDADDRNSPATTQKSS